MCAAMAQRAKVLYLPPEQRPRALCKQIKGEAICKLIGAQGVDPFGAQAPLGHFFLICRGLRIGVFGGQENATWIKPLPRMCFASEIFEHESPTTVLPPHHQNGEITGKNSSHDGAYSSTYIRSKRRAIADCVAGRIWCGSMCCT